MRLEECLPAELQGSTTVITRIAAGMSGAGVYRVEAAGRTLVLKVSADDHDTWRRKLAIQRLAAEHALAPAVVHVDDVHRAVLSEFVIDRSLAGFAMNPATRDAAIALLGGTLRRVHDLPIPEGVPAADPHEVLAKLAASVPGVPAFAAEAAAHVLAEAAPGSDRALVLSHNDANPSNLAYDGERLWLLDWDVASPNDPLYDLATVALFLRLDDAACLRLLAAHDGAAVAALPARFGYLRRLVGALIGTMMLFLARQAGFSGGDAALDSTPGLGEYFQRMRTGQTSPATPAGKWEFGLALLKEIRAR